MRKPRSKWKWLAALGLTALVWQRCSHEEPSEVTIHFELAAGAAEPTIADSDVKVLESEPLFDRPAAELAQERAAAVARSGEALPDLGAWRSVRVRGDRKSIDKAVARLRERDDVVTAFEAPKVELPYMPSSIVQASGSCPIKTPPYDEKQGYLKPAPAGIDAAYAWGKPGGRGDKVWFADIEGAWNAKHEDIPGDRVEQIGRSMWSRDWEMHGTAVLGEVVARTNDLGMVGIAPDVPKIIVSSVASMSAAKAIDKAQAKMRPGDVLLIELHAIGPRGRFLPMEFWDDVYDVIKIATARGVAVIEAAGNGFEDLDHDAYEKKFDRKKRDSGAIMVGAGAPAVKGWTDRSRLDFSNYGGRVDVQGWGRMVATLDYGDLQGCDATNRKYTNEFAGTSSASPIVAGAAILIESIYKTEKGCPLAPLELRKVLASTGSPQTDGPSGPAKQNIGPRPNLAKAIEKARVSSERCAEGSTTE